MVDSLGELDEPVIGRTLMLNVIHTLNETYTSIGIQLKCGCTFLTFLEIRNDLLLGELA
jgi:hypothetical protein